MKCKYQGPITEASAYVCHLLCIRRGQCTLMKVRRVALPVRLYSYSASHLTESDSEPLGECFCSLSWPEWVVAAPVMQMAPHGMLSLYKCRHLLCQGVSAVLRCSVVHHQCHSALSELEGNRTCAPNSLTIYFCPVYGSTVHDHHEDLLPSQC